MTAIKRIVPHRSPIATLALLLSALVLGACCPGPVVDPPAESVLHGIDITFDDGRCLYSVIGPIENGSAALNPQLQDSFMVRPLDELLFRAEPGMEVTVRVHESPEGVPGLAGEEQARDLGRYWRPLVRDSVGFTTGHQIDISCCLPAGNPQCEMQPAYSPGEDAGMGSLFHPPSYDLTRRGPADVSVPSAEDELLRPGGPKMIVME